jgi:DNA polymerase III epsilon subunit family exonuclease
MLAAKHRRQRIGPQIRHPGHSQRLPRSWKPIPEPPVVLHPNRPQWMSGNPRNHTLIFFDLETTGGNPFNSEVIEIAAVKQVNGQVTGTFNTLVNPKRRIPRIVREMTGIDDALVSTAPMIDEVIDDFLSFVGEGILVSHGAINDYSFVVEYAKKLRDVEFKNFYLCTHLLVTNLLPNIPNKKLTGVADYFAVTASSAHRALADAETTQRTFWKIFEVAEKNGYHSIEDLLKLQADNATLNRLGSGLLTKEFDRIPSTPGILYLFNASREIAYMTATTNLKKSVQSTMQLSEEREFNRLLVDLTDFRFERTPHFLSALLREDKELHKLELPIDPRRYEGRSNGFIQVLLPLDLVEFLAKNPQQSRIQLPVEIANDFVAQTEFGVLSEPAREEILEKPDPKSAFEEFLLHLENESRLGGQTVPIRKTRKANAQFRNPKFKLVRSPESNEVVRLGHLQEGLGWCFGPFDSPKLVRKTFLDLITLLPFTDDTLSIEERLENLDHALHFLHGTLPQVIEDLELKVSTFASYLKPKIRSANVTLLEKLKIVQLLPLNISNSEHLKTGLALISNPESKDLDLAVVIKGRIRKETKLPGDDVIRLRSSRFFTRLFSDWHGLLSQPWQPMLFSSEACNEIELFAHWDSRRKSEGEWVDFADLEALYDVESLG